MRAKIENRFISLYEIFRGLKDLMGWGEEISLNRALLDIVVISYFDDIKRYRTYHGTDNADPHKKSAFTIKWISKIKPVIINVDGTDLTKDRLIANDLFAVIAGLSFLKIDITDISDKFFDHLLYTCQYRDIDCHQMATSMYLLEKAMNKEFA